MSIASPTLRSSSSTVPGPRLSSSPTSMWARPSTAETCTGTSNTASRSAAPRVFASAAAAASSTGSGIAPSSPLRLGNGTWSVSAIVFSPAKSQRHRAAARRDVAPDRLGDRRLGRGTVVLEPAVGPFDPAVAGRDLGLGHHHQASVEAACARHLFELGPGLAVQRAVDAHDEVGRRQELAETLVGERRDLGERLACDQLGRELPADRERDLDRLRLEPVLDRLEAGAQLLEPMGDALERACEPPLGLGARLRL